MGSWGYGVLDDDLALDVYDDFIDAYNAGEAVANITEDLCDAYSDCLDDPEYAISVWIALARAHWECCYENHEVLGKIKALIASGDVYIGFESEADKIKRRKALERFLQDVDSPREKARRRVKKRPRVPLYQPGDCLAISVSESEGTWAAAIVLKLDVCREDAFHLLGGLHGVFTGLPGMEVFEARDWLRPTYPNWQGELQLIWAGTSHFKEVLKRGTIIDRIGETPILADDPVVERVGEAGVGITGPDWISCIARKQHEWEESQR